MSASDGVDESPVGGVSDGDDAVEQDYLLMLGRLEVPPAILSGALLHFGSATAIFRASEKELLRAGMRERALTRLYGMERSADLARERRLLEQCRARLVPATDPAYPTRLREILDPPALLYVLGDVSCLESHTVAIVGTRKVSDYGQRMASRISHDLAEAGVTVVSGMAVGVDATAHRGAIEAGGRTAGVLACGVDVNYPAANARLREQIATTGVLLTEFAPGIPPSRWAFPQRNRIISGLSLGVVVIEAPEKSGALITATQAADQGREVFAVPGDVLTARSRGCHRLIQEGAYLVETAEEVMDVLKIPVPPPKVEPLQEASLSSDEARVLAALSTQERSVDSLCEALHVQAAAIHAALLLLEMKGLARRLPGGRFVRA